MSKTLKIHVVEISSPNLAQPAKHYVRDTTPAAARNWLLDQAVTVRVATQDDVIEMAKAGIEPIGPNESVAPDTAQADAFENESRN